MDRTHGKPSCEPGMSPTTTESGRQDTGVSSIMHTPVLSSQTPQPGPPSLGHLQTNMSSQLPPSSFPFCASTTSDHSNTPNSHQSSPNLPPEGTPVEATVLNTGSSIRPSPESLRGRDIEQFPPPLQLGDSVLSRRTSTSSLAQSLPTATGSVSETAGKGGIIRRLSSRARAPRFPRTRRQSSAHPNSRDGSLGPGVIRRGRSNSNTLTDSDGDDSDSRDDLTFGNDGSTRDYSPTSTATSVLGSISPVTATSGPVVPLMLLKGTWISKVSGKRKSPKRIPLTLDLDAAKITWDKTRPSKCIYIDDIKEIRTGSDIRQYRLDAGIPDTEEDRFFSILYAIPDKSSHKNKMMHLIADDKDTFADWVQTLDAVSKHRQDLMVMLMSFNDKAIRLYWESEMARKFAERPTAYEQEELDLPGVERVCRNLHIHASPSTLKARFNEADARRTGRLNFVEFQEFVRLMARREDIRAIYREFASDTEKGITRDEFLDFLREVQGENVDDDLAGWESIFNRITRRAKPKGIEKDSGEIECPRMSETALANFLTSTFNLSIDKEPQNNVLDRPMNEYFISSSHNTYLLGRQLIGVSSVEGYISALMRSCRCVEVDCWDGSDGQPIVMHGNTFTTQIQFREVINIINKYAFVRSQFPLWISLEVHCNPAQQAIMAEIMKEVFGFKLVTKPLDLSSDRLPSPSELKGRILIKVKKPGQQQVEEAKPAEANGRRRGNSLTSPYPKPVPLDNSAAPSSPLLTPNIPAQRRVSVKTRVNTITEGEVQEVVSTVSSSTEDNDSGSDKGSGKKHQSKIIKVLGELGVYSCGIKFNGFEDPDCKTYNHILSFMEATFSKNSKPREAKRALYRHNMRFMMRVYPNQTRVSSTNFDPLIYWRRGVQMAALNWQTFDLGMQLNQAMFDGGADQSGYVLKPSEFREIQVMPNLPGEMVGKRERKNVNFTIDVISAQQLMRPMNFGDKRTVDPYVEVEVFLADDKRDKLESGCTLPNGQETPLKYRTHVIRENGFNPVFDRKFTFKVTTKYPDLAFVRWSVKLSENGAPSDKAPALATFTAKLSSLKQGYRTIPLLDHNGDQYLFSTLFCRIKKDPITSVYVHCADGVNESGNVNKFKRVFNRTSNISPKSSIDSGQS